MKINLKVLRYDSTAGGEPAYQLHLSFRAQRGISQFTIEDGRSTSVSLRSLV